MRKPVIFISCGQSSPEEVELGQRICDLIRKLTPYEPYFADNQNSVDGLTTNIFKAILEARGFIAVMHRRGWVFNSPDGKKLDGDEPVLRASVWVEQEIAVAAFLRQALDRDLLITGYVEKGVKREGVRGFIILNPKPFTENAEVLEDLAKVLVDWAHVPSTHTAALEVLAEVIPAGYLPGGGGEQHALRVSATNTGAKTVRDWKVEIEVPKGLREPGTTYSRYVRSNDYADIFRVTHENPPRPPTVIQSGDTQDVFHFDYSVTRLLEKTIGRTARVRCWADDSLVADHKVVLT